AARRAGRSSACERWPKAVARRLGRSRRAGWASVRAWRSAPTAARTPRASTESQASGTVGGGASGDRFPHEMSRRKRGADVDHRRERLLGDSLVHPYAKQRAEGDERDKPRGLEQAVERDQAKHEIGWNLQQVHR